MIRSTRAGRSTRLAQSQWGIAADEIARAGRRHCGHGRDHDHIEENTVGVHVVDLRGEVVPAR